eukprot:5299901-Amphidinium_carterae.1
MSGSHHHLPFERQPQLYGALPLQYRAGTSISTTKSPPTWSPEHAHNVEYPYTLAEYEKDVRRWQAATEVAESRQGPLLSLAVGGAARSIADEVPTEILRSGGIADLNDGRGNVHRSGVDLLLHALHRRFPANQEATMIRAGLELLAFCPRKQETIEAVLLRFDRLLNRADQMANLQISWSFRSWILFTVLRLSAKKWADLLERIGHRFPRTEAEYRQLEMLLQRETVLHETLSTLNHLQHNQHTSWSDTRHRLEGQRYWTGEEDPSDYPHGADDATLWDWPADGTYYDETDAYEEDEEDCDSEATDEDQWAEENAMDPYTPKRLHQEQVWGQDPTYLAGCYWAARRSIRRFRAATGKFQRRGFRKPFRKGKGKGKGKQTSKKGKPLPFMTGTFYEDYTHGGDQHHDHSYDVDSAYYKGKSKGKAKDKSKDKKGAQTPQSSTSCPATHNQYPGATATSAEHTEAETSQGATWAGHAGHFHAVSAELPGQTGHFLTNIEPESADNGTDIIQFGTCPAGEPCAPPDYVYMVSQHAMAESSEANADARSRSGRSVPVHGTLNVQGHLWIREEGLQATAALITNSSSLGQFAQPPITIASMSQLRLHQSDQAPVDQQPTSTEQSQYGQPRSSYTQIAQAQPSRDEFGNRLYDLQGLLGTKVTMRASTTTNEEKGAAETKAGGARNIEQTETTPFPRFRDSLEAQGRALSQPSQYT